MRKGVQNCTSFVINEQTLRGADELSQVFGAFQNPDLFGEKKEYS